MLFGHDGIIRIYCKYTLTLCYTSMLNVTKMSFLGAWTFLKSGAPEECNRKGLLFKSSGECKLEFILATTIQAWESK